VRASKRASAPHAPGPSPEELSRARRTRALEEPLDVRPRIGSFYAEFEVRNPRHATRYAVFLPEFPGKSGALCNCTDFGRRGLGTCKHIESVLLWMSENSGSGHPQPAPFDGRASWAHIDAAIERLVGDALVDPLSVRTPGFALIGRGRRSDTNR
jgi:hypothetical protein